MRWTSAVALGAALAVAGCEPLEEDCPQCEQACWEGDRPCLKCKKRNRCPLDAAPEEGDAAGALPPLA